MKRKLDAVIELSGSGSPEDAEYVGKLLGITLSMSDAAIMAAAKKAQAENKGSKHPGIAALADALYVNLNKPDSTRSTDTIRKLFTAMQGLNRNDHADEPELFGDINLKDPASYASEKMQKVVTDIHRRPGLLPEGMPFVVFKARILSGEYPDIVRAELEREAAEAQAKMKKEATQKKKAGNAKEALQEMVLPPGYSIKYEESAKQFTISGKFDEDLNTRIRRAGGAWNGVNRGNRRLWEVPESKAASLKTVLVNWAEANGTAIAESAEQARLIAIQRAAEKEQADAAMKALRDEAAKEPIPSGQYGKVSVKWTGSEYRVGFPYDAKWVARIKSLGGHGYNSTMKTWGMNPEDKDRLQQFIDSVKAETEEQDREGKAAVQAEADSGLMTQVEWLSSFPSQNANGRRVIRGDVVYEVVDTGKAVKVYAEDVSSLGGPYDADSDMWMRKLKMRRDESAFGQAMLDKEKAERESSRIRAEAAAKRRLVADKIQKEGEIPPGDNHPEGKVISSTQNIYGGGDWFVVGKEWIWYVRNNGADGDFWGSNNVRTAGAGAIGWRVPYSPEMAADIMEIGQS